MKEKETITMTKEEIRRLKIINELVDKKINGPRASIELNLSVRQVRRIKSRFLLSEPIIPEFNEKFAVVPKNKENVHRAIDDGVDIMDVFSIKKQRVVCNDYTVRFDNNYFQLEQTQPTTVYKRDKVIVQTNIDGKISIKKKDILLNSFLLPSSSQREIDVQLIAITRKKSDWKPPIDHPWRKFSLNKERICKERDIIKVGHF